MQTAKKEIRILSGPYFSENNLLQYICYISPNQAQTHLNLLKFESNSEAKSQMDWTIDEGFPYGPQL